MSIATSLTHIEDGKRQMIALSPAVQLWMRWLIIVALSVLIVGIRKAQSMTNLFARPA